jgi:hypothetical protein
MRLDLYANVNTKRILDAIGLKEEFIPRPRGVGIEEGKILVHTRTGGGNREAYDSPADAIDGEYGIDQSIKDYEEPTRDYIVEMSQKERDETIAEMKERKDKMLQDALWTNEYMRRSPFYLSDEDDDWDSTYANFWFKIPEKLTKKLEELEDKKAKAVFGNAKDAIGLLFGDEKAVGNIKHRLDELESEKEER